MHWVAKTPEMSLQAHIQDATLESIRNSLRRHVPLGHQQNFYLWGTSPGNSHQKTFLQIMGILQLVNLASALLEDLVEPEYWPELSGYIGQINAYFMYEIVSDDLAIGLSPFATGDSAFPLRREILFGFNYVMTERLHGEPTPTIELMQPLEHFIQFVSGFEQSLTPAKHSDILAAYLKDHPDIPSKAIEYGIWPLLVANIESCRELTEMMSSLNIGPMLQRGFVHRYKAVTALLEDGIMSRDTLLDVGTWTILVAPTLIFYVGVVCEILYPQDNFSSVMDDGLLEDAIYTGAQIVRLLNDMGGLVMATDFDRQEIMNLLFRMYQEDPGQNCTTNQLLFNAASQIETMARIHKDLAHNEFNICLNNLAGIESIPEALTCFGSNLEYYAEIYRAKLIHLDEALDTMTQRLGNNRASTLISRFVKFHQKVYANNYTSTIGEYSI